jgi:G3E family GTPase
LKHRIITRTLYVLFCYHLTYKTITTVCLEFDAFPLAFDVFDEWLQSLLWERQMPGVIASTPIDILRMKALVRFQDGNLRVYQGVGQTYDCRMLPSNAASDMSASRIVLIGRGLDKQKLMLSLQSYTLSFISVDSSSVSAE